MNIKCSELDNLNLSLEYYNSIKQISEELFKFIKGYRQILQEYMQKLQNIQSNFKKKLEKSENNKATQIILSLISKLFLLFDQNNELFQISIDDMDLRIKEFDNFTKKKNESIKLIQKSSQELNKSLSNSYSKVNKAKSNYLNSLSKTEELINQYYSDKNKLKQHENGLGNQLNENEYTILKEQQKNQLNEVNNAIKASKELEGLYKNSISSSKTIYDEYVKKFNAFAEEIKKNSSELSGQIKNLIVSLMLSYKNNYKQPLTSIDVYINQYNSLKEGEEIDKIISQNYKNDNLLKCISPSNYKLKSISFLKDLNYLEKDQEKKNTNTDNKNSNILKRKKTISKLEDGFDQMQYISDESFILTIKTLFNKFDLIDKEDFNLQLEENKNKTQEYILKIIANMNSNPYAKYGKNSEKNKNINPNSLKVENKRKELSTEELLELKDLLDNHENRIIFLQKLSDFRSKGKFYLGIEDFSILSRFFNIIADKVKRDIDYHAAEMSIILSQTYFIEDGKRKKYIQESIKENKLFKDKTFWEEFLVYSINKEIMKTLNRDSNKKENKKHSDAKFSNVVFAQILTIIDNMFEFDIEPNVIKEILEPKIKYYKLDDSLKDTINEVILSKQKEKENIKEEKEKEKLKMEEEKKIKDESKDTEKEHLKIDDKKEDKENNVKKDPEEPKKEDSLKKEENISQEKEKRDEQENKNEEKDSVKKEENTSQQKEKEKRDEQENKKEEKES